MPYFDHKAVIATIEPEIRKSLLLRSNSAGIKQTLCHSGLIICSGLYIFLSLPLWQIILLIHGILLIFLFTALHETIHETAFKSTWLNIWIAYICGSIIFLPPRWFREFHYAHHRHTNIPELDPELAVPKPRTLIEYCKYLSGIPLWIFHIKTLIINALGKNKDNFVPKNKFKALAHESRWFLTGYFMLLMMSLYFKTTLLIWLWLIPIILGQPFLRAYLLAEHTLCPQVTNILANTRTTLTNRIIKMIAWNMPYHAEHHSLPGVPFYRLPAFHVYLEAHLKIVENGRPPVVIDSDDLLEDPMRMVESYCGAIGIPFIAQALSWTPGDRGEVL